jgi:hypothetical protein
LPYVSVLSLYRLSSKDIRVKRVERTIFILNDLRGSMIFVVN